MSIDQLRADLARERDKSGTTMTVNEGIARLNTVTWLHRGDRWGLSGKSSGNRGRRYDGTECSADVIQQRPEHPAHNWEGWMVDVLESAGFEARPDWNVLGQNTQTSRPWVAPIEPREPPQVDTAIGLSWFPALGLYRHDRHRYNEALDFIRQAALFTYARVFYYLGGEPWGVVGTEHVADSERRDLLVRVIEDLLGLGVAPQLTVFGTWVPSDSRRRDLSEQFRSTVRPYASQLFAVDCYNEPGAIGVPEYGYVRELGRLLANEGYPLLSLASPDSLHIGVDGREATEAEILADAEHLYGGMPSGVNAVTPHWNRAPWRPNYDLGLGLAVINDEPRGFKSSVSEIRDPRTFRLDYRSDRFAGVRGYTLHTEPGVWMGYCDTSHHPDWGDNNEYPTFQSIPRIDEILAGLREERGGPVGGGGGTGSGLTFANLVPYEIGA